MMKKILRILAGGGYLKETLKYILRSKIFIHKYICEIENMYDMEAYALKARNEKIFLDLFVSIQPLFWWYEI